MDIIPLVKGKYQWLQVTYSRLLLSRPYNWIEYNGKGIHWGLEKPLLVNILQMEGRYQLNLAGFYKTLIIGTKVCVVQECPNQAVFTWE